MSSSPGSTHSTDGTDRTTSDVVAQEREASRALAEQRRLRRARAPWTSMVLSLAVVLGIVVVLILLVPRVNQVTQPPVDVRLGARAAAAQVEFTPSVPGPLPEGWRATSVRTTRSTAGVMTWHAGFQTADQQYAAFEQGQDAPQAWVAQQTNRGTPDGTQTVAGEQWKRYTGGREVQNSLVHVRGRVTTIVTGTAPFEDLAVLAEALQPPG